MKRIIYIASILSILNTGIGRSKELSVPERAIPYLTQIKAFVNTPDDDKFKNWTEEQYKHYEDSIQARLYPPVIAKRLIVPPLARIATDRHRYLHRVLQTHMFPILSV